MLILYNYYRRWAFLARAVAVLSALSLAVVVFALPKPHDYASPQRLAMTITVIVIAALGTPAWVALRRRARDARLVFAYHGAPRALGATAAYLGDECRASRRGLLPVLVAAILLLGFNTLAAWPQFSILAPWRGLFAPFAIGAFGLAVLTPYWHRKNIINAIYLKQYLRQQARQVGFRPHKSRDVERLGAELARPAVSCATATGFRAGGFEWELDDFQKNAVILGQPGSGKTVAVLNTLLEGMFATSATASLRAAGCILDVKGDFKVKVETLANKAGTNQPASRYA